MKRFYKIFASWFLCLFLVLSQFIVSFADVKSLMIGSSSNALMTLELDDSDYLMMSPRSSVGTVENTISNNVEIAIVYYDTSGISHTKYIYPELNDNRFDFYTSIPDGYIASVSFGLLKGSLPNPGGYKMSFDFASDFSVDLYSSAWFRFFRKYYNANSLYEDVRLNTFSQASGDIYIPPVEIDITSINWCQFRFYIKDAQAQGLKNVGGSFAVNFTRASVGDGAISTGEQMSDSDYQSDISSSLSDLSSSVDSMTEDLSSAAENLEYISTSQNLIIQGIDNVVMHISDQLFAFWNQLYNLIHEPTMAKMDDIISAINNMDLEIEVNLDGLKTTINNMSTAVQNKLQSVSDTITGGYDNSGMESENNELSGAVDELDQAEKEVLDNVSGYITDFEYPSFDSISTGIIGALSFFGGFLHSMFLSMGSFGLVITFSLTMIFVLIIVGYHRIRS